MGQRGRKKLVIDKAEFQRQVNLLENAQTFVNPSALWQAIEQTEWAKTQKPRPLTAAVCYARAKELGIVTKTQPGKRDMSAARANKADGTPRKRRPRSEKMKHFAGTFTEMRKEFPSQFLPLISREERGSAMAAIMLKCIECSGMQRGEARQCVCTGCALYPFRPGAMANANGESPEESTDELSLDDVPVEEVEQEAAVAAA